METRTITLLKNPNGQICSVDTHNDNIVNVMWKPWTSYRLNDLQKTQLKQLGFEIFEDASASDYEKTNWCNTDPVPFRKIDLVLSQP